MPVKIQVSALIDRPVAEVFHFYAHEHVRNHPRWDPDMQLEQISAGPIGVGTIIRRRNTHSDTPVEGSMEVVEFEPNQAMGVVIHDGPSETRGRVTFRAEGSAQTTLTIQAEFLDMDESLESMITSLVERSARNIKQLIESEVLSNRLKVFLQTSYPSSADYLRNSPGLIILIVKILLANYLGAACMRGTE